MPLTGKVRLSHQAREAIKRLLRGFYHRLLVERVPDRLTTAVSNANVDRRASLHSQSEVKRLS
jgi:hypothetical protein